MPSYEVIVRATVIVEDAEDETEAAEVAMSDVEFGLNVERTSVESIRKLGDE